MVNKLKQSISYKKAFNYFNPAKTLNMSLKMNLRLLIFCLMLSHLSFSQTLFRTGSADLHHNLTRLISDYETGFVQLKAEVATRSPQTITYHTHLQLSGIMENTIVEHTGEPPVYSWSALLLSSEDFETARKKYAAFYNQVRSMVFSVGPHQYRLKGAYEAPSENKRFASTTLSLYENSLLPLQLVMTMDYEFPEWTVRLRLYEKQREDDEAPQPRATIKKPL